VPAVLLAAAVVSSEKVGRGQGVLTVVVAAGDCPAAFTAATDTV